jgi:hypothetical protein
MIPSQSNCLTAIRPVASWEAATSKSTILANSRATDRGEASPPLDLSVKKSEATLAFETNHLMSVWGLLRSQGNGKELPVALLTPRP